MVAMYLRMSAFSCCAPQAALLGLGHRARRRWNQGMKLGPRAGTCKGMSWASRES